MKKIILMVCCFFAIVAFPQEKPPAPAPKPVTATAWYKSWDSGEIKTCVTLPREPDTSTHTANHDDHRLLICDNGSDWHDSYINLQLAGIDAGRAVTEADRKALEHIAANGKHFMMIFPDDPWPNDSKGQKARRWTCTKTDMISCSPETS